MSEPVVKRRPGRPSKAAMAAAAAAAASTPKTKPAPNSATTTPKDGADKASAKKTPANKRAATAALDDSVNLSGGRSKRTPKPNPKYMDDVVFNATKALKEDSTESDLQDDEIEGNLSSDDYRAPSDMPLKKRSLHQKTFMQKKSQGNTPGRKPTVALKRKSGDAEINIDGDDARQLFLAAKRQYTHSPLNSEEESDAAKRNDASALAAKLRSRTPNNKILPGNRANNLSNVRIVGRKLTRASKNEGDSEDSEQTPTFTIVNIDDIISEKGEIVIKKQKRGNETETSDDDANARGASDQESPKNANNRRKTQHTKILSEERIIRTTRRTATPPVKTQSPLTTNKLAATLPKTFQARVAAANGRLKDGSTKPTILRPPPPRILNSTLCKPSNKTVPSLVTKLVSKNDLNDISNKQNNNTISARSKENVTSYTYTEKDGKLIPKKSQVTIQRKSVLPVNRSPQTQRIITSPQSNQQHRSIKKITCFETWYVIKMPDAKPKVEKPDVTQSLIKIGNEIKNIELPNKNWSYKINLQAIKKDLKKSSGETKIEIKTEKAKSENLNEKKPNVEENYPKAASDDKTESKDDDSVKKEESETEQSTKNDEKSADDKETVENVEIKDEQKEEVYTGEVQDANIDPNEKHNYQPISIMFRRKCQNQNARIQFDRIVVLKNNTFYLNVDGKNIKLLGAPLIVENFDDIQVLLQIVNDVNLSSKCVELTTQAS